MFSLIVDRNYIRVHRAHLLGNRWVLTCFFSRTTDHKTICKRLIATKHVPKTFVTCSVHHVRNRRNRWVAKNNGIAPKSRVVSPRATADVEPEKSCGVATHPQRERAGGGLSVGTPSAATATAGVAGRRASRTPGPDDAHRRRGHSSSWLIVNPETNC